MLLAVKELGVSFRSHADGGRIAAVDDVSIAVAAGESVGLVGGSGSGKSTVARAVAGLEQPDRGRIVLDGRDLLTASRAESRRLRRALHLVFQDPYSALPPTLHVAEIVAEPLLIRGIRNREERRRRAAAALEAVRLLPVDTYLGRYAHQLSGGERQRVAFARALIGRPKLILADEPTQMLDASLRGDMIDLLTDLTVVEGVALLHITHDLALAQRCDRLVVMHAGRVIEQGVTDEVLTNPRHPYTAALVDAAHRLHGRHVGRTSTAPAASAVTTRPTGPAAARPTAQPTAQPTGLPHDSHSHPRHGHPSTLGLGSDHRPATSAGPDRLLRPGLDGSDALLRSDRACHG